MDSLHMLEERNVVVHQGTYKHTATTAEAVFMITGMTIGAGILGLPYAISKVGIVVGVAYILVVGLIVLALNLMIGEIASRTPTPMQLPGFAAAYFGRPAKMLLSASMILRSFGTLLAYMLGAGIALHSLLGADADSWSVIFWSVGAFLIWGGLERIKKVEKVLSLSVMIILAILSLYLLPHFSLSAPSASTVDWLYPFGVILFALNATPAIAESYALLPGKIKEFRKAVSIGTIIPIALFVLFSVAVVGVFGASTPEVATVALGEKYGFVVLWLANIFAIFAMSNCFMGLGTALKESLVWDNGLPVPLAKVVVIGVPLVLFLLGARSFVTIMEVVGGIFISLEAIVMVLVYGKAHAQPLKEGQISFVPAAALMVVPVFVGFVFVTLVTLYRFAFGG